MYWTNPPINKAWAFSSSFSWLYGSLHAILSESQGRGTTMGNMGVRATWSFLCHLVLLGLIPRIPFSSYYSLLMSLSDPFMTWWVWENPVHSEHFWTHSNLVLHGWALHLYQGSGICQKLFLKDCNSLLWMAWPCFTNPGNCVVILSVEFVMSAILHLLLPVMSPTPCRPFPALVPAQSWQPSF